MKAMKEYKTVNKIAGPLVFVEKTEPVGYGTLGKVTLEDGFDAQDLQVFLII